jgi:hypothetical protein
MRALGSQNIKGKKESNKGKEEKGREIISHC